MAEEKGKPFYLSKTLWTNLIMGVLVVAVPSLGDVLSPDVVAGIFMGVNLLLRLVTKEKLQIS